MVRNPVIFMDRKFKLQARATTRGQRPPWSPAEGVSAWSARKRESQHHVTAVNDAAPGLAAHRDAAQLTMPTKSNGVRYVFIVDALLSLLRHWSWPRFPR